MTTPVTAAVDCSALPSTPTIAIISVVVTASVLWLAIDAWHQARGARWLATMTGGIIFGEVVEYRNITSAGNHSYCYPDLAINVLGVPFWVPVGWGGIIFAATWTAQRLRLPPLGRALAAAFLAASIDFSLDPVARLLGFWQWQLVPVSFCGVPYDNYIGWYLIVFVYSLTSSALLGLTKHHWNVQASRFSPPWWKSVLIQWGGAFVCALGATLVLLALQWVISLFPYSSSAGKGNVAAVIFIALTTVGALVTLVYAARPVPPERLVKHKDAPINWPVMLVPGVIHVTCYALFLIFADWSNEPMLFASIPIQLLAGAFVFSTPWRGKLP